MDGLSGLAFAIQLMIWFIILFFATLLYWLSGYLVSALALPVAIRWFAIPIGILVGLYVTYFVVFDDLGKSFLAKTFPYNFEIEIPKDYRGLVWIFFDPTKPDLQFSIGRKTKIAVPQSAEVLVGAFEDINNKLVYAHFDLYYPDGTKAPQASLPMRTGGISDKYFMIFYIGDQAEVDRLMDQSDKAGTRFPENEMDVLARLLGAS